ncbi:hypothetical protein HMPREF3226_02293 [Prevotella corporis]|uniref:Uncharacterized protein n=1 Tax=Prevotella corporis TaxID=28128 RepID=A0A133PWE2_9BACT|nr:hypothetical protein HMPREF3226_02293 [Prevotella corporis]
MIAKQKLTFCHTKGHLSHCKRSPFKNIQMYESHLIVSNIE